MNGVPILKKHQVTTSNESQNKQSRNIFRNTQREKEKEACVTTLYSTGLCSLTLRFYLVFRLHYDSQGAMVRKTKKNRSTEKQGVLQENLCLYFTALRRIFLQFKKSGPFTMVYIIKVFITTDSLKRY